MMAAPFREDKLTFAMAVDRIFDRADCTMARQAVARAIIRACGLKGYCTETREELAKDAKTSLGTISAEIKWMVTIGEITIATDLFTRSRRRLILSHPPTAQPSAGAHTDKRLGARKAEGSARHTEGAFRYTEGSARHTQGSLFATTEERGRGDLNSDEEREFVSSPPSLDSVAGEPIEAVSQDETRRDEFASLQGEAETQPQAEADPTPDVEAAIAEREATITTKLAEIGGEPMLRLRQHAGANLIVRVSRAQIEQLRAGNLSCLRDDPPARITQTPGPPQTITLPPPEPRPEAPTAPRVVPGDGLPIPALLAALGKARAKGGDDGAKEWAMILASHFDEADNRITLKTFRDAFALRPDWVAERIVIAHSRDRPAPWLSSTFADAIARRREVPS